MSERRKSTNSQSRKALAERRRRQPKIRRIKIWVGIVIVIVTISASWYMHEKRMWQQALDHTLKLWYNITLDAGLKLENIYIEGIKHLSEDKIIEMMNQHDVSIGDNVPIMALPIESIKQDIEKLSWVDKAIIVRQLPKSIHIHITEKKPFALWQKKKVLKLIDGDGSIITDDDLYNFKDLPIIVGSDSNKTAKEVFLAINSSYPSILEKLDSAIHVGNRRWDLILSSGIRIKLPEQLPGDALKRLKKLQEEEKLLDRKIKSVDLRLKERLFIEEDR